MDTLTITNGELPALIARLSPRQREVVKLFVQGMSYKQIATELTITTETVRRYIKISCRRVGVENRIQLIVLYAQWWATEGKEQ